MKSKTTPRILIIDNDDSFTMNVVDLFRQIGVKPVLYNKNDISIEGLINDKDFDALVLSPGPGHPSEAVLCSQIIDRFYKTHPILGICLGHQVIAQYFGATVGPSQIVMHGKTSEIMHSGGELYRHCRQAFLACRYNSLIVQQETLPQCLELDSWCSDISSEKVVMGISHKRYSIHGVQFHPDSVLTPSGLQIIKNFISIAR